MTATVGLDDIRKEFRSVVAVRDVSVEVERGQFVTLLGPSGCGKTTLLRIVAGLETPTRGEVYLEGARVTTRPPQARGLGFAFQRYALFPHLTVLENVAFGLKVRRVRAHERRRRALEMLELVRLAHLADRLPAQISGGQAQRVALARALAPEPRVLLLDEPLTALDLAVRTAMQEELRRLHRELGTTFVYVTHDQGEALTMSDRIVLMLDGAVVQDSSPFELYRRPRSLFAATFVGESNVWYGEMRAGAGEGETCEVRVPGLPPLRGRCGERVGGAGRAVYVVRPQTIRPLAPDADREARDLSVLQARIDDVIARGAHALVLAAAGEAGVPVRFEVDAEAAESYVPGVQVELAWSASSAIVFAAAGGAPPPASGEREPGKSEVALHR